MKNTKFIVKVNRMGARGPQYLVATGKSVKTTSDRRLALAMGKYTAQDAIDCIQSARCTGELIPIQLFHKADDGSHAPTNSLGKRMAYSLLLASPHLRPSLLGRGTESCQVFRRETASPFPAGSYSLTAPPLSERSPSVFLGSGNTSSRRQ